MLLVKVVCVYLVRKPWLLPVLVRLSEVARWHLSGRTVLTSAGWGWHASHIVTSTPTRGGTLVDPPDISVVRRRGVVRGGRSDRRPSSRHRGWGGTGGGRGRWLSVRRRVSRTGVTQQGWGPHVRRRPVCRRPWVAIEAMVWLLPVRRGWGEACWPDLPARRSVAWHSLTRPHMARLLLVREVAGVTARGVAAPPTVRTQPGPCEASVRGEGAGEIWQSTRADTGHHGLVWHHTWRTLPYCRLVGGKGTRERGRLLHGLTTWHRRGQGSLLGCSLLRSRRSRWLAGVQGRSLKNELDVIGVFSPLGQHLKHWHTVEILITNIRSTPDRCEKVEWSKYFLQPLDTDWDTNGAEMTISAQYSQDLPWAHLYTPHTASWSGWTHHCSPCWIQYCHQHHRHCGEENTVSLSHIALIFNQNTQQSEQGGGKTLSPE